MDGLRYQSVEPRACESAEAPINVDWRDGCEDDPCVGEIFTDEVEPGLATGAGDAGGGEVGVEGLGGGTILVHPAEVSEPGKTLVLEVETERLSAHPAVDDFVR